MNVGILDGVRDAGQTANVILDDVFVNQLTI